MKRHAAWALGAGFMVVGLSTEASAQVRIDIGVVTPHIGAHVVVGAPRVVYVPVTQRAPVYVRHGHRRDRGYHKDVREARREYERDLREARLRYERDLRRARRRY
jgi:hypothetical protein